MPHKPLREMARDASAPASLHRKRPATDSPQAAQAGTWCFYFRNHPASASIRLFSHLTSTGDGAPRIKIPRVQIAAVPPGQHTQHPTHQPIARPFFLRHASQPPSQKTADGHAQISTPNPAAGCKGNMRADYFIISPLSKHGADVPARRTCRRGARRWWGRHGFVLFRWNGSERSGWKLVRW